MFTDAEDEEELQGGLDTDQDDEEEEGTPQEPEELDNEDDEEDKDEEADEGGEKEGSDSESDDIRTYIDQKIDGLAENLARGTQSMIDKAVDRMARTVKGKPTGWTRIVEGFAKSEGIDIEDLPDTSKCKTPQEAFDMLCEAADKMERTSAATSQEFRPKINDREEKTEKGRGEKATSKDKPKKRNEVKSVNVPKKAGRGGIGDTRDALREKFNAGQIDIQQYSDGLKKLGLDPMRD